ncbi:MAG TPA: cyclic nucleotide-binding domain-containing protein, partial [Pyrinomonadaceae bacterium]|nr:cyclic nucleotide-binding domain-containing protein [Pyrinomonadaceae bacterium]
MDSAELKELLKGATAFSILSDSELEEFVERFQLVHYTLGQSVVRAGDDSDAFYVVYSGRARVVATNTMGEEVTVGTLTRGNSFGEQGLLTRSPRKFTIRAASDLALLRLDKKDFEYLVGHQPDLRNYFDSYLSEISIRNFLKLCTAFAPLTPTEIRGLLNSMEAKEYSAKQRIIREGDPGDAFYLLRSGGVEVIKESDGARVLNRLKAGDSFGELALLTGQVRAASIITTEPSSVFRLDKADFDRILASSPRFKDAIVSIASGYSEVAVRDEQAASEGA